jgi:hypothetical protein
LVKRGFKIKKEVQIIRVFKVPSPGGDLGEASKLIL